MRIVRLCNKLIALVIVVAVLTACQNAAERAAGHEKFGIELFSQGKYRKAALEFSSALKEDSTLATSYYYLALISEKNKRFRAMRGNLIRAVKLKPEYIDARVELGRVHLLFNDLDDVLNEANEVLKYAKDNKDAILLKAAVFIKQNQGEEALPLIEGILQKSPEYVEAISLKALLLMQNDQFDSALALVSPIIESGVNDISLHLLKIKLDAKQNNIDAVIADYLRLSKLYPENNEFKVALAKIYSRADKKQDAENVLRELVNAEPKKMQRKLVLLDFLNTLSKEKALSQLQQYSDANRENPAVQFKLSQWLYENLYLIEAKTLLTNINNLDKKNKTYQQVKLLLAKVSFQNEEFEKSLAIIDDLIQRDSEDLQALVLQAKIFLVLGKIDDAELILTKVLWSNPQSDESLVLLAEIELARGFSKKADKKYSEALEVNPANINALTSVVNRALRNENAEYAGKLISKALVLKPNNVALLRDLAEIKMLSSDWKGVEKILASIAKKPDGGLLAKFLKGKMYKEMGDCPQATSVYKEILSKYSDFPDALRQLAVCYELMDQRPQLIVFLNTFMENNPENIVAYIIMGKLYTLENNFEKASDLYQKALNINKKIPQVYAALAKLYEKQNKHDKVIETYKLGLEENLNNVRLSIYLASAYQTSKDYDKAAAVYESLLAIDQKLEIVLNNYAALLVDFIATEESIKKAQQLVTRFEHSDNPFYLDSFAWTELKSGNVDNAIFLLEKVNVMAQLAVFKFHLGVAYLEQGNKAGAIAQLQQSVELGKKKGGFDEHELAIQLLDKLLIKNIF